MLIFGQETVPMSLTLGDYYKDKYTQGLNQHNSYSPALRLFYCDFYFFVFKIKLKLKIKPILEEVK